MFRGKIIVLALLCLAITAIVMTFRSGRLKEWAVSVLDKPPADKPRLGEEFTRKLDAARLVFEVTHVPFADAPQDGGSAARGPRMAGAAGPAAQWTAQVRLRSPANEALEIPLVTGWQRIWSSDTVASMQAGLPEGHEATPYRDGVFYVEQRGLFSLNGVAPIRPGDSEPVIESFWHYGDVPLAFRMTPISAMWVYHILGIESEMLFLGPANTRSTRDQNSTVPNGFGFVTKRWTPAGSADPQDGGSAVRGPWKAGSAWLSLFDGTIEWTEWMTGGPDFALTWTWISDADGRNLLRRGIVWSGGAASIYNTVSILGSDATPAGMAFSDARELGERSFLLGNPDGAWQVETRPRGRTTRFGEGRFAYLFDCRVVRGPDPSPPPAACNGAGMVRIR